MTTPRVLFRRLGHWALIPVVLGLEGWAVAQPCLHATSATSDWLPAALGLHLLAVAGALAAACLGERRPTGPELDAIAIAATFVPVFGPALAWSIPRPAGQEPRDAHAAYVEAEGPSGLVRGRLTRGDPEDDVAHRVGVELSIELIASGTLHEKRDAVRELARLGGPRHLAALRTALVDPLEEVRLAAQVELARIGSEHEELIRAAADAVRDGIWTEVTVAERHLDYAQSDALDPAYARYHVGRALRVAALARAAGDHGPACARVGALAHLAQGDRDGAARWLAGFETDARAAPEARLAVAQVAFAERDFDRVRSIAAELAAEGHALPTWFDALRVEDLCATGSTFLRARGRAA